MRKFADNFWDDDFNGTTGYDTVINYMKDGKKLCDSYIEFLTKRAKLEEDYAKNLIKLANQSEAINVTGTMQTSWLQLKKETECVGSTHMELSKKLNDLAAEVQIFREKQKNERKKVDELMRKLQKDKKTSYEQVLKHKKAYEQRCRESDACKREIESKPMFTPREEDRLKKNLGKAKTNEVNADSTYQSSVQQLDDIRRRWILEMTDTCNKFEDMETERIKYLRNQIWVYTNLGSVQAVALDERYESIRKVLENCSEIKDIQLFIQLKSTGKTKPAPVKYENRHHMTQPTLVTNDVKTTTRDGQPAVHGRRPPIYDDRAYSNVTELQTPPSSNKPKYRIAEFDYDRQGYKELELKAGDIIEVIRIEDAEWAIGKLNGVQGAFPLSFTAEHKLI